MSAQAGGKMKWWEIILSYVIAKPKVGNIKRTYIAIKKAFGSLRYLNILEDTLSFNLNLKNNAILVSFFYLSRLLNM